MRITERIHKHIETLAAFTSTPGAGVTRVVYTEEDRQAKDYMKAEAEQLGLTISEDEIGNIFATWKGKKWGFAQVWTGSHLDAPTHGGNYDGVVGVFGALEAVRLLQQKGFEPERDLVMVIFAAEEPTRFGMGCLGSRALTGKLRSRDLDEWRDEAGQSLRTILEQRGKNPEKVLLEQLDPSMVKGFLELHIEQGAVLENEGLPIGLVNRIAAPTEIQVQVFGEQRHAGTTPMKLRKDPVPAVAELILKVEEVVQTYSESAVGTVGKMQLHPGASNVIAESVEFTIDMRDSWKEKKDKILQVLEEEAGKLLERRNLRAEWKIKSDDSPSEMDQRVLKELERCATALSLPYKIMSSGAYHDAMIMSEKVPCNMIFIPSKDGISHAPSEFTDVLDIEKGIRLLAEALQVLTNE
ncbi:M20 family metallo-hydrolase [Alkalihalobacillus oceani]|uniref:M20 family metallo-hydrolase n=1 Tax=Halalkalibacter oceani TaxID=1653776 RepID=UPI00203CE921|nr:M20 family metallo-hydrolase [Halalkalibacter oceani]